MMATQFFIMATGFLDTVMAGRYSAVDLAGVAMGSNVLWPVFMLLTGITMALTPIVSQLRGSGSGRAAGTRIRQGLWITVLTSTVIVVVILNAEHLFRAIDLDEAVIVVAVGYLDAIAWGVPPVVVYVALRHTSEGLGKTMPPMLIAGAVLPINAFLNYAFIYGNFGFPELGGAGCGWATAIVFWLELGLMILVVRLPFFRATRVWEVFEWPNRIEIARLLKVGVPIGLSVFLEMAVYSVITFMIGRIGVVEVAAHSIAGNLNWLTYVLPMSLGAAASIRVGYFVGAQELGSARHVAGVAFRVSIGYAVVMSMLLVAFRMFLVSIYTNDPQVLEIAANLMLFIAVYQIVDDTLATTVGALRGYKDTKVPMIFSLIGFWLIALPLGTVMAFGSGAMEPLGVYGYWTGLTIGLFLVAVAMIVRLWRTSHDEARVAILAAA
jgi:MATE family multidrug resistance protein